MGYGDTIMVGEEKNGGGRSEGTNCFSRRRRKRHFFFFLKYFFHLQVLKRTKKKNVWSKLKSKSKWGGKCGNSGV